MLLIRSGPGWKLLLPAVWTQAFFVSFIYAGPRLVCLDQKAQLAYEAGRRTFPNDFPGLAPHSELAEEQGQAARLRWQRHPPAKRVNYARLGVEDAFVADWGAACGLPAKPAEVDLSARRKKGQHKKSNTSERHLIPTATHEDPALETVEPSREAPGEVDVGGGRPWLLNGRIVSLLVDSMRQLAQKHSEQPIEQLMNMLSVMFGGIVDSVRERDMGLKSLPLSLALISVRLTACGGIRDGVSGTMSDLARIYRCEGNLVEVGEVKFAM